MTGEVVPAGNGGAVELHKVEETVVRALEANGLPTVGVFVTVEERLAVAENFYRPLARLSPQQVAGSLYLSKFFAAVAAGLFDAALNYLWDETISELRRRVTSYDLSYFFDTAVNDPTRRNKLSDENDLKQVQDVELTKACLDMGLISETGYQQLELIRYMRNHASAAHPNQNEFGGLQLMGWLDTCVREVIALPETPVVAQIRKLLANLKNNTLANEEAAAIGTSFPGLPGDQAHNLVNGFFGLYTNLSSKPNILDNIRKLLPHLWPYISEATRANLGTKYGRYLFNNDADQAKLAREFLDIVQGSAYMPSSIREAEIDRAVDDLLAAHRGYNNFYTEPSIARALDEVVGKLGDVPRSLQRKYVLAVVEAFVGYKYGVSWNASPVYRDLLARLDVAMAQIALESFTDEDIRFRLQFSDCQRRWLEMLDIIEPKLVGAALRERWTAVKTFPSTPDKLALDSNIQRMFGLTG